jgi:DNA-directed RNA polymerase specialized sigma24 family protein
MNLAQSSHRLLAHFIKTHDEKALVTLLERHYQEVFEFVLSRYFTDEDIAAQITDDAFNWMQHMDYDRSKPFSDWLRVLAGYVAIDYTRVATLNRRPIDRIAAFNLRERDAAKLLGVTRHEYQSCNA